MRARISAKSAAPLACPKVSHAIEHGKVIAFANTPPPTMKFLGEWSLNKNNSPAWSARKFVPEGAQKFTSGQSSRTRKAWNQS
jgi:hypothetical protein